MPPLPPVAKVIRFDLRQSVSGNVRVMDRFFLNYTGTLSSADLGTILTTVRNAWNTNMAPVLCTYHTLNSVTGTDLSASTAPQAVNSLASTGTAVCTLLPNGGAMVVKFRIARRYRGGHPRLYLGGLGAASLATANTWTAGAISSVLTAWQAFIAAAILNPPAAVGVLGHVSVRYFSGFTVVTNPITRRARNVPTLLGTPGVDSVLGYSVNNLVASQRRRNLQSP